MELDQATILSLASIGIAIGGYIIGYVKFIMAQQKSITTLQTQMASTTASLDTLLKEEDDRKERLKALEVKIELWWNAIQTQVITMLKHPYARRRDSLLDKLADKTITLKQLEELKDLLKYDAQSKKKEALAAVLAIARIEQLSYDMQRMAKPGPSPSMP